MNTNKQPAIEVNNLTKIYDKISVVKNVSFTVNKGETFGFLGPNGAGKTTTIKSMLGLIKINEGEIKINTFEAIKNRKKANEFIGYLPELVSFYDNLTALQNLYFYADFKNVPRAKCIKVLIEMGLKENAHKKVGKFSHGMIQRLGMARALLGSPQILILDEPSSGLDPRGVKLIRDKIKELKKQGVTIFISSHILGEVQAVCDRVGIIDRGNIVAQDNVEQLSLKLNLKPKLTLVIKNLSDKIVKVVKKVKGVEKAEIVDGSLEILCDRKIRAKVIVAVEKAGGNIINLLSEEPTLEEVFMKFTEE
jgi:ABC-2 type transport system ATP-binding protein